MFSLIILVRMAFDAVVGQLMRVPVGGVTLHLEVVPVVLTSLLVGVSVDQTGLERDDCSRFRVCPRNGPPRDMSSCCQHNGFPRDMGSCCR